jgi:hypothetical protein
MGFVDIGSPRGSRRQTARLGIEGTSARTGRKFGIVPTRSRGARVLRGLRVANR